MKITRLQLKRLINNSLNEMYQRPPKRPKPKPFEGLNPNLSKIRRDFRTYEKFINDNMNQDGRYLHQKVLDTYLYKELDWIDVEEGDMFEYLRPSDVFYENFDRLLKIIFSSSNALEAHTKRYYSEMRIDYDEFIRKVFRLYNRVYPNDTEGLIKKLGLTWEKDYDLMYEIEEAFKESF